MVLDTFKNKRFGMNKSSNIFLFQVLMLLFLCIFNMRVHAIQIHEGVDLSGDATFDSASTSRDLSISNDEIPVLNDLAGINNVKNELSRKFYYSNDSTTNNELSIADALSASEIDIKDEIAFDDANKGWSNLKGMVKDVKGEIISGLPEIDRVVVTDFFNGSSSMEVSARYDTSSYSRHSQSYSQDNNKAYKEYSSNDSVPMLYLIYHKLISFFEEHFILSFLLVFIALSLLILKTVIISAR